MKRNPEVFGVLFYLKRFEKFDRTFPFHPLAISTLFGTIRQLNLMIFEKTNLYEEYSQLLLLPILTTVNRPFLTD